jgi:manganese transport protein
MAGGAQFGYLLLWVILMANLMGMVIQSMSAKLGIATGMNLPEVCRERFSQQDERRALAPGGGDRDGDRPRGVHRRRDRLEHPLRDPLFPAALITSVAAFAILALQARGFRRLEAVIVAFIGVIVVAFAAQVFLADPDPAEGRTGVHSGIRGLRERLLAVGIIGATVMPHVIYLHSALTQHRVVGATRRRSAASSASSSSTS